MSRSVLRSVLELRTPLTRLPPSFLLPIRSRAFNTTASHIEPSTSTSSPTASFQTKRSPPTAPIPQTPAPTSDATITQLLPALAAQPGGHYITVHIHGKPYLVTPGDQIRLPFRMPGVQPGDVLRLNRASVLGSRDFTLQGAPYLNEKYFECRAVVIGEEAEPLRIITKKKQRQRRKTTVRSKHKYTVLRVQELKIVEEEE